ncbi:hypothetical protein MRB53_036977 [Persea americana]|nr:hypothetical protein MRB53_036977 [Persea americana]
MPSSSPPPVPSLKDLSHRGFIKGLTYLSPTEPHIPTHHYYGGLPYALPPTGPHRWKRPRPLPPCYRYGHRTAPGDCTGGAGVCPQPTFGGGLMTGEGDGADGVGEDCLQLNVWVPAGAAPEKGWPVVFYIHGGWLQLGTPNTLLPGALLTSTSCKVILVAPAYRLNVFGFLASHDLESEITSAPGTGSASGNFGFWDQRLALEWTYETISCFGGDAANITVMGYSAGAYSTFHQLSHDLLIAQPHKRLIRRAAIFSNGPGLQPKSLDVAHAQYLSLCAALNIRASLSGAARLAALRALPAATLLKAATELEAHEFRPVDDSAFIPPDLFAQIDDGSYGSILRAQDVHIMLGECAAERHLYAVYRPPVADTLNALRDRLGVEFPPALIDTLLEKRYAPDGRPPRAGTTGGQGAECRDWDVDAYGAIYADLQVHALQRGFVSALINGGAARNVHRYRMEWRPGCAIVGKGGSLLPEWGVTHTADMPIWFFGNGLGDGLSEQEEEIVEKWLGPVSKFYAGELQEEEWGARTAECEVRVLDAEGKIVVRKDKDWERGVKVWETVRALQRDYGGTPSRTKAKM